MPELPEVEAARRMLEREGAGRCIVSVACAKDPLVFEGKTCGALRQALLGARIGAARRRGKHLWLELEGRPALLLHFGMTGHLHAIDRGSDRPRFWRLDLELDDGRRLVYADARRLGRVRLRADPENEPPVSRLGFDPLLDLPGTKRFHDLVTRYQRPIKAVLLDQGFAAGVGNWVADEVLYQAGIDPRAPASRLPPARTAALRRALKEVVTTAVRVDADSDRFPPGWLFHSRWGRKAGALTPRGEAISFLTVGGRTTAFVPSAQH